MESEKKRSIMSDLPFYGLVGALGLAVLGIIIYMIWSILVG
jgi:hypothetical protein